MALVRTPCLTALVLTAACAGGSEIDLAGLGGSGSGGGPTKTGFTGTGNTAAAAPASQAASQAATQAATSATSAPAASTTGGAICGDGNCDVTENSQTCPADCGQADVCGDGMCGLTEDEMSCPQDCLMGGLCDVCMEGPPLDPSCDPCADFICFVIDDYCCSTAWDDICVGLAVDACGAPC